MKKIVLFITLISFTIIQSQIVNIPDVNFKNVLLNASSSNYIAKDINNNRVVIDINNDNEIQESEAESIVYLNIGNRNIANVAGIESFINLTELICRNNSLSLSSLNLNENIYLSKLDCSGNLNLRVLNVSNCIYLTELKCAECNFRYNPLDLSNNINLSKLNCYLSQTKILDISNNINLTELYCNSNIINNLDLSNNPNLSILNCSVNSFTSLDLSSNINLTELECIWSNLTNLDLSNNPNLIRLTCGVNHNLRYINLKNGNNEFLENYYFSDSDNIQTICIDDLNSDFATEISNSFTYAVTLTEYCSFEPTQSNIINGTAKIDIDNNGCDVNDVSFNNVLITANNGTESFGTFVLNDASYTMFTNTGDFTTSVTTNLPSYWSATPTSQTNTFTGFDNIFTADFCIQPNQTVNDVNISLIPTNQARPGFDTTYKIVYKNVGTTQLNGNVILNYDETKLSFSNASETVNSQTNNSLTFNYSNLNPFETRTIDVGFNVFTPTTVNIDDILTFTATINPIAGDITTDDNVFPLNQTVIGSYDPNDITCLEGDEILLADTDKYLHYVIRFQNTGTASAINIVVKNILDASLDWSTLQLENLSHTNRVAIKNGNEIEFIFENINLPDSTTDEPNSHGFIAYKIKPKADIGLGNIIPNKVDIFFDFNEAIETNTVTTTIVNTLSVNENILLDFSVYPTPTENILHIKSKTEIIKIEIYSKLGQLILINETENNIDISNLTNDLYFVKVEDINGNFGIKKIIKK